MNFFKRAFRNLIYKKAYNIMLILLFIILATLILSCLSISKASKQSCDTIRRELGGAVTMRDSGNRAGLIPISVAQKAAKLKNVESSNFFVSGEGYAYDFKAVNDPLSGLKGKLKTASPDINMVGVTQTAKLSSFTEGIYKLVEGRHITADDTNSSNILIEKTLAAQDKLKIGSKITLSSINRKNVIATLNVVGVYLNTGKKMSATGPVSENGNMIYLPYKQAQTLINSTGLDSATYYLDDPINIDAFKASVSDMVKSKFVLDAQDADYRRMSGSLSSLTFLSGAMFYGILIVSIAILSLIVVLSLKDRKYEIGVLLSVGEKRIKIISQLVAEIIIPVIIAFSISIATGTLAAQKIGNIMLNTEKQMQQSMSGNNEIKDYVTGKTISADQKMDVKISADEILILYSAGIVIALLSAISPVIFILRYSPKKILIDIE